MLTDDTQWILPRRKGSDGKKRQLKKDKKKIRKRLDVLRDDYPRFRLILGEDVKYKMGKYIRGIYGSCE